MNGKVRASLLVALSLCLPAAVRAGAADGQDTSEPVVELSLEQAISMALEHNVDIVVARRGAQAQGERVGVARGAYRPFFDVSFNNLNRRRPSTSQLTGAQTLQEETQAYDLVWRQLLPTGGNYQIAFNNSRGTTNSAFFTFNPRFDSALGAQVTQPLMRDFRYDPTKQQIVVARNGERVTRHQFEVQVMNVIQQVENAYWDLVSSIRQLEVAKSSLELAQDLLRNNRIQVEVGTMAPIDVLEAEAEVAAREEAVIVAEEAIRRNEDVLKRLINDPESPDFWSMRIRPVDQPRESTFEVDLEGSVATALERRPELASARVELDTRDYNVRFTGNQLLPRVDLVGSIFFNGIGGDQIIRQGFAGEVLREIPGGYRDALDQLFGGDFRDWSIGLNLSYPIGRSAEEAAHAQARIEQRQQRAALTSQELVIVQEVREAARRVETALKRMEATRVARDLARRRLEAEQKKFEVGMSTSFLIVQAQRDLAQAEANELQAIIDYNKAIVDLERARGTLLDRANVSVR